MGAMIPISEESHGIVSKATRKYLKCSIFEKIEIWISKTLYTLESKVWNMLNFFDYGVLNHSCPWSDQCDFRCKLWFPLIFDIVKYQFWAKFAKFQNKILFCKKQFSFGPKSCSQLTLCGFQGETCVRPLKCCPGPYNGPFSWNQFRQRPQIIVEVCNEQFFRQLKQMEAL